MPKPSQGFRLRDFAGRPRLKIAPQCDCVEITPQIAGAVTRAR